MKLKETHIQELYKFTKKHFVEHYDVQTELVDHLANDIEEISKGNSNLSFEQARDTSFKKFGVFGFMDIVEKKQKELSKKYWKILWRFAKEWFQLPKIILTFGLIFLFDKILQSSFSEHTVWIVFITTFIYALYKWVVLKKKFKKKSKKWMMEDILLVQSSSIALIIVQYPIHILNYNSEYTNDYNTIIVSSIIVVIGIFAYVSLEVIPKKAEKLLEEVYPEYKMDKTL